MVPQDTSDGFRSRTIELFRARTPFKETYSYDEKGPFSEGTALSAADNKWFIETKENTSYSNRSRDFADAVPTLTTFRRNLLHSLAREAKLNILFLWLSIFAGLS